MTPSFSCSVTETLLPSENEAGDRSVAAALLLLTACHSAMTPEPALLNLRPKTSSRSGIGQFKVDVEANVDSALGQQAHGIT